MHYDAIRLSPIPVFGPWALISPPYLQELLAATRLIGVSGGLAGRGVFSRFDVLGISLD
jgi:hypothetical protein